MQFDSSVSSLLARSTTRCRRADAERWELAREVGCYVLTLVMFRSGSGFRHIGADRGF